MPQLNPADDHAYSVSWSDEDQEYVGLCAEFPSLSWLAPTPSDALEGIRRLVQDCKGDLSAGSVAASPDRGHAMSGTPTATSAHYNDQRHVLVVRFSDGHTLQLNPDRIQGLENAQPCQLQNSELSPSGLGLHFPELDADVYLPSLLAGRLGTIQWMENLKKLSEERS
jgi:Protein of unknown function (DUF2442)